ncbi:MAG TPA: HAMP domain-containing sensor histidine kinase, partial [Verrucomicrobiota bacterium]|nr:HAMP domain-containing sensor histidine kinase [Verrucomicrobiota bacterium]
RVPLALGLVGALTGAYRFRVRTLRRRQAELSDEVARRTEELRKALETVEGQTLKLQELDQAKSKFFANLSHEFRTPLMLTLGPLRDVHAGRHGPVPPPALAPIEMAIRQAGRQLELVDQLLLLARLDAGQLEFRPRVLRLDEFLRRLAAPYIDLAERQQLRFTVELPDHPVHGLFDEGQLDPIFGNLLGNAFKFTPPGGSIALRLVVLPDGGAEVQVEDTGPGIPGPDLPHLFERFYRSEQSRGRFPGTGLGLAVAKECVEQHGGGVRAENRAGGGARFSVRLRTVPAPWEDPPVCPPPGGPS